MDTLGERIRSIRGKRSRDDFSNEYSIHPQSLGRYESNLRTPQDSLLDKISKNEGISFNWIKFGTGPTKIDNKSSAQDLYCDREFEPSKTNQHSKIINHDTDMNIYHDRDFPASLVLTHYMKAVEENAALVRENGDLRVEIERYRARIRELEREVEALRKAMKTAAVPGVDWQGVA